MNNHFLGELHIILFIFSFIWRYFDFVIKFCFFKTDINFLMKLMFVVVDVWFCRLSSLAFLILAYLINLLHHFLLHWFICFVGYIFVHTPVFLKDTWNFCVFLSVPHFVENYAKIVDERGRNITDCTRRLHITEPPCFLYWLLLDGTVPPQIFMEN